MRNNIFYCKSHFSYLATATEEQFAERRGPFFGTKLKFCRHKMFKLFSPLLLICFLWEMFPDWNGLFISDQLAHGFKVHDLITCKSKVLVILSLGSYWVLCALGSYWVLSHDMLHVLRTLWLYIMIKHLNKLLVVKILSADHVCFGTSYISWFVLLDLPLSRLI